jgi:hypothetical protein
MTATKLERGCADCGYRDDPAKLHFDHRPGTIKLYNISRMACHAPAKLEAEIDKTDVRCIWCHKARHDAERKAS